MLTTIVCPIKTIKRYDSLPTLSTKYTHAQNVLTVTKRVERSQSIVIIKHKYMLMCNHKIRINIVRRLRNSTVRREIGQLHISMYLCLMITIDCERFTLLVTINTFRACVYFAATVGKLSYLVIVLMGHTMVVNIQFYFLSLDLVPRWLTRDIG